MPQLGEIGPHDLSDSEYSGYDLRGTHGLGRSLDAHRQVPSRMGPAGRLVNLPTPWGRSSKIFHNRCPIPQVSTPLYK